MSRLRDLLRRAQDPSGEVAHRWEAADGAGGIVRWEAFRRDVTGLREVLCAKPPGPWVLLTEDAYAFAVGLFALWHAGCHAISPPNHQPSTLGALQTRAVGVLSDRPDWFQAGASLDPLGHVQRAGGAPLGVLDPDALAIELFTSGTTGEEKSVVKRLAHLEEEVEELHATWSDRVEGCAFFAAASHQHLYGLLFGVLWPLRAGRPFQRHHHVHPGELVPRMREAGACVLISVPTQLRRLVRHVHVGSLRGICRAVFSSGGPLGEDAAHELERRLGAPAIEVLGSTETGGVAWRTQRAGRPEPAWSLLRPVRVSSSPEGLLRVRSPFVSEDSGDGFVTGDRVTLLSDGGFRLHGRADRVAKIGEKRLDLARMESDVRSLPEISEASLGAIERDGESRVAAAIVPSERGWALLRAEGQRGFARVISARLTPSWDPVLHPRHLRLVAALPSDPQGKITLREFRALFDAARVRDSDRPFTLGELRGADFIERTCEVPSDLACLADHFPGDPIVPGVLQLDWAMELAADLLGQPVRIEEIASVKFLAPMRPGARFRLLTRLLDGDRVEFHVAGDDVEYARGRVRLAQRRS